MEKEKIEEEKRKKRGRGIVKKKNKKEEEEALRMAEEKKKQEEERKKEVPFLDQDNLDDIIDSLKICLEKMAKLIILMISYDKPHGKYSQVHSVKFFEEFLQNVNIFSIYFIIFVYCFYHSHFNRLITINIFLIILCDKINFF